IALVAERLSALHERDPGNLVIARALSLSLRAENNMRFRFLYYCGYYLAEATYRLLRSSKIHAELIGEIDYVQLTDDGYEYFVKAGEFPGFRIESPVALVADRLRREMTGDDQLLPIEFRSAWLLLACASSVE